MRHYACGSQHEAAMVYKSVVNDVVNNVKEAFLDEGVDESILNELRSAWEERIKATNAVDMDDNAKSQSKQSQFGVNPTLGLQQLVRGDSSRGAMMAQAALPSHRSQGVIQHTPTTIQSYVVQAQSTTCTLPTVPAGSMAPIQLTPENIQAFIAAQQRMHGSMPQLDGAIHIPQLDGAIQIPQLDGAGGTAQQRMHGSMPQLGGAIHISQLDGAGGTAQQRMHGSMPQLDGAIHIPQLDGAGGTAQQRMHGSMPQLDGAIHIPQLDGAGGISDDEDDVSEEEDNSESHNDGVIVEEGVNILHFIYPLPARPHNILQEPLNSDDDADSDEEGEAMFDADNVVICQYEKVSRVRTKWKIILKDGIMNVDGRDFAFQKATGEAEW